MLDDSKQGAVRVTLDHLTRLLRASTKKRPVQPPKLSAVPDEKGKLQKMLSELLAKMLVERGMTRMDDHDLRKLVFRVVQDTELEGTVANPGRRPPPPPFMPPRQSDPYGGYPSYAAQQRQVQYGGYQQDRYGAGECLGSRSNFTQGRSVKFISLIPAPSSSSYGAQQQQPARSGAAAFGGGGGNPMMMASSSTDVGGGGIDGGGGGDEFDDLTVDELRSLLDNFKNLSKAEQKDLIQYMRKLETTNPDKVRQLKSRGGPAGGGGATVARAEGGGGGGAPLSPLAQKSMEGGANAAAPSQGRGEGQY